jgi:hypothetical protein
MGALDKYRVFSRTRGFSCRGSFKELSSFSLSLVAFSVQPIPVRPGGQMSHRRQLPLHQIKFIVSFANASICLKKSIPRITRFSSRCANWPSSSTGPAPPILAIRRLPNESRFPISTKPPVFMGKRCNCQTTLSRLISRNWSPPRTPRSATPKLEPPSFPGSTTSRARCIAYIRVKAIRRTRFPIPMFSIRNTPGPNP